MRNLYASLLRCRLVQEQAQRVSSAQGLAAEYAFAIGEEAVVVGATAGLQPEDTITAVQRNLAALIARG